MIGEAIDSSGRQILYRILPSVKIEYTTRIKYLPVVNVRPARRVTTITWLYPVKLIVPLLDGKNAGKTDGVNSWLQNLLCEKLLIDTSLAFKGDL
jgi:hypothetical protein